MHAPSPSVPDALAAVLVERQRAIGAGPAAERNAALLAKGARCVVTGQQPGLFGGPLLVLHKAIGAIAEAARRSTSQRPVVPVFWVASDDHDWDEVSRATVMDVTGHPRVLSIPIRGDGRSLCDIPIPASVTRALLDRLAGALPDTASGREAARQAESPQAPTDLATWFCVLLPRLLGDRGLVFVEPRDLSPFAGEIYAAMVRHAEAISDAVRTAPVAAGEAPLLPAPATAPLFLREEPRGKRRRVSFEGDRVLLRGLASDLDRAALEALVRGRPELASADVIGRVLLQDALLPVDAYVAGPHEALYLEQVAPAHRVLGLSSPVLVPRPSATWAARALIEAVVAAGVDPASLVADDAPRLGDRRSNGDRPEDARRDANRALEALRPRNKPQERVVSPFSIVAHHGLEALRRGLDEVAGLVRPGVIELP